MKNFGLVLMLLLVSIVLNAQPQPSDCVSENNNYRASKDGWIVQPKYTPFNEEQLAQYKGLNYYDINCSYKVEGSLVVNESEQNVGTTNGGSIKLLQYGTISFIYKGRDYQMIVYQDNKNNMPEFKESHGAFFIAFKDPTNTDADSDAETWKDGRYLIVDIPAQGNSVTLDFNMAINPFEAYNSKFTTLNITGGSVLEAPLTVGERKYEDRTR